VPNINHFNILKKGVAFWNEWRRENPKVRVILSRARLDRMTLDGANFSRADLHSAIIRKASLRDANFAHAILTDARLQSSDLTGANLRGASLSSAYFRRVELLAASFIKAELEGAIFHMSNLGQARFNQAYLGMTSFLDVDLRDVKGLDTANHVFPSEVGVNTIFKSEGQIPESFLLGCGLPESFITHIPALIGSLRAIQFYSCFISYSSKDEEFVKRLHSRMRQADLRVWFAPEDIKGGKKLREQIDRAIQLHDRLLLVLSENSMKSEWVTTEIRRARKTEIKEGRRKLFPIRLVDYDSIREWECFDADYGKDLAVEVREYYIPDFSSWKNHDEFERSFARLLADLKASA
jgi:uncharacterized protein YjbI with pentapeptide repeats